MGSLVDTVMNVVSFGAYGQKEAAKKAADAQRKAEMEARRIAAEKKPMEESATTLVDTGVFGADTSSLGLTVEPTEAKKKMTGLGTASATTGLGFGA